MAVTLKMISERVGLTQAAVSQILNRKPNDLSSEETKKKVFAIAEELGYKQKFGHKLLRGDKTNTVALLIAMHNMTLQEHTQKLLMQLLTSFGNRNYSAYTVVMESSPERNLKIVQELCNRGTDQFIFLGGSPGHEEMLAAIAKHKKRTIGFDTAAEFTIKPDTASAVKDILKFFLSENCPEFKMLLHNARNPESARFMALQQMFPECSAEELIDRHVVEMKYDPMNADLDVFFRTGYEYTARLLKKTPDVQAVFYHSDYFAVGGIRCLVESGRIPGKDILVAGFNDIHAIRTAAFPVSTATQPIDEITAMILAAAENNSPGEVTVTPRMLIRK